MHKREFVSTNLHRLKDRLGAGTARRPEDDAGYAKIEDNDVGYAKIEDVPADDHVSSEAAAVAAAAEKAAAEKAEKEKSFRKALEKRREEFQRLKRDIDGKLTEVLARLPDEAEDLRMRIELVNESEILFKELSEKAASLDDSAFGNADEYSSSLADAMKTLENIRLEIIRQVSKMDKAGKGSAHHHAGHGGDSFMLELASLSFKQLFRLGLYFYLPLLAAVVFCALAVLGGALILAHAF